MAVLPLKKAKGLADVMAKNGISGSIAMKAPAEPSADEADDSEDGASELENCASDLADAIVAGDKEAIKSAILDLADCVKQEDYDQDEQLGE